MLWCVFFYLMVICECIGYSCPQSSANIEQRMILTFCSSLLHKPTAGYFQDLISRGKYVKMCMVFIVSVWTGLATLILFQTIPVLCMYRALMLSKYKMFIDWTIIFLPANIKGKEITLKEFLFETTLEYVRLKSMFSNGNCLGYCLFCITFFHF